MSGSISSAFLPFGETGRLGAAAATLNNHYDELETQASSGLIAQNVADLGPSTKTVLDLQPQLATIGAWSANVTLATNRLSVAQSAMTSIEGIASSFSATLSSLETTQGSNSTGAITAAASEASSYLQQLGSLLNTQSGDSYIFGGADPTTAPVASGSLSSGALNTAIGVAVSGLSTDGASATLSAILSAATDTSAGQPFSAAISGTLPANGSTAVGSGETVADTMAATSGTLSTPTSTSTGSPVRDLVAVLSAVANLSSSTANSSDFESLISSLGTVASTAASGLAGMAGEMGASQDFLTNTASTYSTLSDDLTSQIGSLTSVDLPTVSTELQQTSTALQASYELIADLKGLSLADYL